jgi:hypothetical protein
MSPVARTCRGDCRNLRRRKRRARTGRRGRRDPPGRSRPRTRTIPAGCRNRAGCTARARRSSRSRTDPRGRSSAAAGTGPPAGGSRPSLAPGTRDVPPPLRARPAGSRESRRPRGRPGRAERRDRGATPARSASRARPAGQANSACCPGPARQASPERREGSPRAVGYPSPADPASSTRPPNSTSPPSLATPRNPASPTGHRRSRKTRTGHNRCRHRHASVLVRPEARRDSAGPRAPAHPALPWPRRPDQLGRMACPPPRLTAARRAAGLVPTAPYPMRCALRRTALARSWPRGPDRRWPRSFPNPPSPDNHAWASFKLELSTQNSAASTAGNGRCSRPLACGADGASDKLEL